ncbi:hypothetical protein UO65_2662 [Actinokineospora spheciospongiae]|uniref:Uncharacterized protein n=1 Tax=Actinokineospora spheciospongiae TaxID=909613 RepID=W7IZP1_9PSEU|nr:hypothetical protein UO65_2662 [Actinokineospora spheciospongiae]
MPDPVPGVRRIAGDEVDGRFVELDARDRRREVLQHGVHQRRVERVRDRQPLVLPTPFPRRARHLLDRLGRTRDHHRGGVVHGRQGHGVRQQFGDLGFTRGHREHGAAFGQGVHEARPGAHQRARVRQGEHARHVRGHDLAQRVACHDLGLDAPGLHQPVQRHFEREQRGLRPPGSVQGRRVLTPHHLADVLAQFGDHLVERFGEHREPGVQLPPHAQPLRTLAREHDAQPAVTGHRLGDGGQQFLPGAADEDRAVLERRPGGGQGEAHVQRAAPGVGEPGHLLAHGRRGLAGHQPGHHDLGGLRLSRIGRGHGQFQDGVGVGAGDAERRHRRAPRTVGRRPGRVLGDQVHRARRPVHVRGRLVHVQRPGHHTVPHRLHHLDHTRHPGRRLGVADVGLDRPEQQRGLPVAAVGRQQRLGLDRVTQCRTGSVALHHVHVVRGQPGAREGLPDHPLLGRAVGSGEAVRRAVLVHRRAPHHGQDLVPVADGVGQPLDHQHPDALGPARAVCGLGVGLAPAVHGHAALPGELDEQRGCGQHGDATGDGQVAVAGAQRLNRPVQCHQRRRARRVHRDRRALQPQRVGDAAGGDARGAAVAPEPLELRAGQQFRVVAVHDPGEDPGAAAPQRHRVDARPLERLPGRLQQQALLGVGGQRLARAHPEELRVEPTRVMQEAAGAGVGRARVGGVGVVERVEVPAAVVGEAADRVHAVGDQPP